LAQAVSSMTPGGWPDDAPLAGGGPSSSDAAGDAPAAVRIKGLRFAKATLPVRPLSVAERCEERRHRGEGATREPLGLGALPADGLRKPFSSAASTATATTTLSSAASTSDLHRPPQVSELLQQVEVLEATVRDKNRLLAAKDAEIQALRQRLQCLEEGPQAAAAGAAIAESVAASSVAPAPPTGTVQPEEAQPAQRRQLRRQKLTAVSALASAGALRRRQEQRSRGHLEPAGSIAEEGAAPQEEGSSHATPSSATFGEEPVSPKATTTTGSTPTSSTPSSPSKPWSLVKVLPRIEAMLLGNPDPDEAAESEDGENGSFYWNGDEEFNIWGEDDTPEALERRFAEFAAAQEAAQVDEAPGLRPRIEEAGRAGNTARRMAQRRLRAQQRRDLGGRPACNQQAAAAGSTLAADKE